MPAASIASFDDVLREIAALEQAPPATPRGWSVFKALSHCAQSIECSMHGYPRLKPAILRKTVGKIVARRFLARGRMSHDCTAPLPGAPDIADEGPAADGIARLRAAIDAFRRFDGELQPHLVFDRLDKTDYERIHALHVADHLATFA
jgi:uncharacterized protein DUF1569